MYDMYPKTWSEQSGTVQPTFTTQRRRRRTHVTQPEVPVRAGD